MLRNLFVLVVFTFLANPAAAIWAGDSFRPWLQSHFEVDERDGANTSWQLDSTGFRPWIQNHMEDSESSNCIESIGFHPWAE